MPCVCVYDGVGYYQNLIEFINYESTLLVTQEELLSRSEDPVLRNSSQVAVLLKNRADEKAVAEYLGDTYGLQKKETLLEQGVHGDRIYLFAK